MEHIKIQDLSILLVEPSNTQRKIIVTRLLLASIRQVDAVASIDEALQFAETVSGVPDLVITSMYFENTTGLDLITKMRNIDKYVDVPFMLVSSEQNPENLDAICQSGVIAILPKPFSEDDLEVALNSTVDFINPDELDLDFFEVDQLSVLLVDDSVTARNHMNRLVTNLGIKKVSQASNGMEALELLDKQKFDFLITDYHMPHMDGKELISTIRNGHHQADIPILMVTAETKEVNLAAINQSGVSAICNKPFQARNLRQVLRNILE